MLLFSLFILLLPLLCDVFSNLFEFLLSLFIVVDLLLFGLGEFWWGDDNAYRLVVLSFVVLCCFIATLVLRLVEFSVCSLVVLWVLLMCGFLFGT